MQPSKLLVLCMTTSASSLNEATTTSDADLHIHSAIAPVEIDIHVEFEVVDSGLPISRSRSQERSQRIAVSTLRQAKANGQREAFVMSSTSAVQEASSSRVSSTEFGKHPAISTVTQTSTAAETSTFTPPNATLASDHVLSPISNLATAASGFRWNKNFSQATARPANMSFFTGAAAVPDLSWSLSPLVMILLLL